MPEGSTSRDRRRGLLSAASGLLAAAGVALIAVAVAGQQSVPPLSAVAAPQPAAAVAAPQPAAAGPSPSPLAGATRTPAASPGRDSAALPRSRPTSIEIPAIGVSSSLVELGLTAGGALQVPQDFDLAGWYQLGPTPGERGPAVIAGHVDSAKDGPAVFFRLTELTPGDQVEVHRADGQIAVFAVTRIERYPKDAFPTAEVYGNTPDAALRLITCGGSFDRDTGHYRDNVVAYADLVDGSADR